MPLVEPLVEPVTRAEYAGQPVEIRRSSRRRKTVSVVRQGGEIVLQVPARLSRAEIDLLAAELVPKLLAREARRRSVVSDRALVERARGLVEQHLSDQPQRLPSSVRWVTNQNQRWGSCSTESGAIRLSHRLQAMPDWVLDHVLLHELVHLHHADHSPDFWALVHRDPHSERVKAYLDGWTDATAYQGSTGPDLS